MDGVIERIEIVARSRRLRQPIRTAEGKLRVLAGVELRCHATDGRVGLGEAPLLAGPDAAERLIAALELVTEDWIGRSPDSARRELAAAAGIEAPGAWALDTALTSLVASRREMAGWFAAGDEPLGVVRTNALITEEHPAAIEKLAAEMVAAGEHTLKLKVGFGTLPQDLDRVAAARAGAGSRTALRLDANQAWDEAEARRRLQAFAPFAPEYLEQPVAATALAALARLRRFSPIPLAADEAVRNGESVERVLAAEAADVLVLKVPLLGTSGTVRRLVERARGHGTRVVLSSLYDGATSLWATVALAAGLRLEEAHGLATGALLEEPGDAPVPHRGRIELPR